MGAPLKCEDVLSSVKIDKLVVPEVVPTDSGAAVLACSYSGAGDDFTVLWLHDGVEVFRWRRGGKPEISRVFEGRLDSSYTRTSVTGVVLRLVDLSLELSGEYACEVRTRHHTARATSNMTVYSPERDFKLTFNSTHDIDVDIKCVAKHLHPQPDLVIEYNKVAIPQQQRTWREGKYYEAESRALFVPPASSPSRAELACRLHLPQVDYTAITKKYLHFGNHNNSANVPIAISYTLILIKYNLFPMVINKLWI